MIELMLLLPIGVIGLLVWRRKNARIDGLLIAHALAALEAEVGRPVRFEGGRGGWYVAALADDGALRLRRVARESAVREAVAAAGGTACHGEIDLSEFLPIEEAGAAMRREIVAFYAGSRSSNPASVVTSASPDSRSRSPISSAR